jgi:DNA-binding XRE family transcriptional regulator
MREKLFVARKRKRLSQFQMAERLGVSLSTYRRIEGGSDISIETGKKICNVLGEKFEHIFLS